MTEKRAFHEDFSREGEVKAGSERALGIVFSAVFAIVGLLPLWDGGRVRVWALVVAGVFLVLALAVPASLKPLNRAWFRLGMLLNRVVSPVVMGFLFYLTVTPIALVMRLAGKDPLRLSFDRGSDSYWIVRDPPGPAPDTMQNQF